MSMLAVISDIHSNLEALQAVLADIRQQGAEAIVCLGDVVGYGPDPGACLDMVKESCDVVIMGNHDFAVLYEPARFNLSAEQAIFWTRRQLESDNDPAVVQARWDYLGSRPRCKDIDGGQFGCPPIMLAHGSPRRPTHEYVFPDDIYTNTAKLTACWNRFIGLCFVGHTHVPGVFTDKMEFFSPEDLPMEFIIPEDTKAIINVGSVGQSRDRDPRASYCLAGDGRVKFIRVEYDVNATAEKILAADKLDNYLGERLRQGR